MLCWWPLVGNCCCSGILESSARKVRRYSSLLSLAFVLNYNYYTDSIAHDKTSLTLQSKKTQHMVFHHQVRGNIWQIVF